MTRTIMTALDDGKAEDVVLIDLAGKTSMADAMVIASGRSNTQVAALADRLARALKDEGRPAPGIEGLPQADWVLIDAGDVIVHIFRPEVRAFYNLEKMWGGDRPSEPRAADPRRIETPAKSAGPKARAAPKAKTAPKAKAATKAKVATKAGSEATAAAKSARPAVSRRRAPAKPAPKA